LPHKLVFALSTRWGILRLTDHVNQRILTDPYCNVRILPNDVQEIIASVKKPPMVAFPGLRTRPFVDVELTRARHAHDLTHTAR
jgi:hypothetical protein